MNSLIPYQLNRIELSLAFSYSSHSWMLLFSFHPFSELFFNFLRTLPGASTSLAFNRLLAWLDGSPMPSGGPPDTAEDDAEGKELQLTLLGDSSQKKTDEWNGEKKKDGGDWNRKTEQWDNSDQWDKKNRDKRNDYSEADEIIFERFHVNSEQHRLKPDVDSMGGLSVMNFPS